MHTSLRSGEVQEPIPGCERILLEVVPGATRDELSYPGFDLAASVRSYLPSIGRGRPGAGIRWREEPYWRRSIGWRSVLDEVIE
jgi:hypothetical protein